MKSKLRRKLRTLRADFLVWLRYRTVRPSQIYLPGCDYLLAIDPNENRARQILIRDVARGRISSPAKLWRKFVAHFEPNLVVDIGLNYGECLFGTRYQSEALLFGFEANPKIFALASRSRENHPSKNSITLTNALISDRAGPDQELFVDPGWSGTASAIQAIHNTGRAMKYSVPVKAVSNLVPPALAEGKKLLFKLDIEGYEPKAMKGFYETIDRAGLVVGLMEFDTQFLSLGGTDPTSFINGLKQRFHIFVSPDKSYKTLRRVSSLLDLPEPKPGTNRRHTDFILIKNDALWRSCLPPDLQAPVD